jgi:hypothetical protein
MTIPHRNDVTRISTRRPDDHHHPVSKKSGGNEPVLAIVEAIVGKDRMPSREHEIRFGKIQASFLETAGSLVPIESDLHNICTPKNTRDQYRNPT